MSKFIEVTLLDDGEKILLNVDDICRVRVDTDLNDKQTYIYTSQKSLCVNESYDEIKRLLNE